MRHGPAEDRGPSGRDFDRPLTGPGREVVTRVAHELHRQRLAVLPRVVASPLVRAQQTAALVHAIAGDPEVPIEARDELAEHSPAVELADELARGGVDALMVGHQPTIEVLARQLAPPGGAPGLVMPSFCTALVVALRPRGSGWELDAVIDPRSL